MADTFLKIGTSFPQGAFRPDGQPNIPSQAYADYLQSYLDEQTRTAQSSLGKSVNPPGFGTTDIMIPRADPVGYVAPATKTPRDEPLSNYGFDLAGDYARDAGQSFKNAVTGQGAAQALPEMKFYPGGPTGAEYVYGGIADAGLGAINTLMAGFGAGAGFVAEQVPFQNENQEDRLSRELLAFGEFAEQYLTPYFGAIGIFSKLGKASKAATAANRAPEVPVAVATEPQITISPTLSDGTSLADAITAAQAAERANRLQVDDILFSPSLRAAMNLKQNKGPYEQLKATMLKNGAKPDELEWSGADDFFSGKNVTKQEIVDYLGENDPRLVPNVRRAEGVLGSEAEAMDVRDAVDEIMEDQPWLSERKGEEIDLLRDYLPDSGYQMPDELSDEYLEELAVLKGTTVDDLRDNDWVYVDENGDAEFFQYSDEAVAHQYGGADRLDEELEIRLREQLENEFNNDPPNFMYQYGLERPESVDAGDTTHSMYFPEGGTDYTESLFQYTDPTGRIKIDTLAKSRHFGEDDAATIFHTRHADYVNEDGDTVRYVGEIQSDPQQNLSSDSSLMSYDQSLVLSELDNLYDDFNVLSRDLSQGRADIFRSMSDLDRGRLGYEANIHDLNKSIKSGENFVRPSHMKKYKDISEIPLSGELTDLEEELVNEWISSQPRLSTNWSNNNFAQELVYSYLKDKPVDWLSNDIKKGVFDITGDIKNKQEALQLKIKELPDLPDNATEGGPFMSSQNKWLDQGLRRSIYDAVKDPDIDYLAFPNDPEAIARVGGTTADTVKEGTVNYYQRDVQNRLKKLLKAFSKDVSVDEINLQSEDFGAFSSKGFKITPEFRKAVMEKGIPTYVVPLAVGTGMGYGALDQVGGSNGQSGS